MRLVSRRGFWFSFLVFFFCFSILIVFSNNIWRTDSTLQWVGLGLAVILLSLWLVKRGLVDRARFPRTGLEWLGIAGIFSLVLVWSFSPDPFQGGYRAGWLIAYVILFFILIDSFKAGLDRWGGVAAFLTVSGLLLLLAVLETLGWYSQWMPMIQRIGIEQVTPYRFSSWMTAPGPLMAIGAMGFPLAVLAMLQVKKPVVRILSFYWLLVYLIALPFSSSRGGWLGLAVTVGISALLIIWEKKLWRIFLALPVRQRVMWAGGVLAGLLLLGMAVLTFMRTFASHASHGGDPFGTSGREGIWRNALSIWQGSPLFGAGPGRFPVSFLQTEGGSPPGWWAQHAHSTYIQSLSEFGVLGFAFWLALVGVGLWWAWKAYRSSQPEMKAWNGAIFAALSALAVELVFDEYSGWPLVMASALFLAAWLGTGHFRAGRRLDGIPAGWLGVPGFALAIFAAWGILTYQPVVNVMAQVHLKGWNWAAQEIQQSVKRAPKSYFYQCAEGLAWAEAWRTSQDIQHLAQARIGLQTCVALEPGYAQQWANLAVLDWYAGERQHAFEHIQRAVEMAPRAYTFILNRGWFKEQIGDAAGAQADYALALKLEAARVEHPFWQGSALRQAAAKQAAAPAGEIEPVPYWQQLHIALSKGDIPAAEIALARSWVEGEAKIRFMAAEGALFEAKQDWEGAVAAYERMRVSLQPVPLFLNSGEFVFGVYAVPGLIGFEADQGQFVALERLAALYRQRGKCDKAAQAWVDLEQLKQGGQLTKPGTPPACK